MRKVVVYLVMLPCLTFFTSGVHGCIDGPGDCTFEETSGNSKLCGWTLGGSFELGNVSGGWHVQLSPGKDTGNLTSKAVCSAGGQRPCLKFSYQFDVDSVFDLSVSMKYDDAEKMEFLLWRISSGMGWNTASVPIHTNHTFSVIFTAERRGQQNADQSSVRIDIITYEKTDFCTFKPPEAAPAKSNQDKSYATPLTRYERRSTEGRKTIATPRSNANDQNESTDPVNNIALIVGVIVGVIVVGIIAVLLIVLCRRRRRHAYKASSSRAASDHPRSGLARPRQSDNRSVMASPQDPRATAESSLPEYAVVNKPRKTPQENPPQSPYEISDQGAEEQYQNAAATDWALEEGRQGTDGTSSAPSNPDLLITGAGCLYQVPRGEAAVHPEDQDEEYNALDFEGKRQVEGEGLADGKRVVGAGDIYNRLSEGDEETYNEVDRQQRQQILGDEYSHI